MLKQISRYTPLLLCMGLLCTATACGARATDIPEGTVISGSTSPRGAVLRPIVVKETKVNQSGVVEIHLEHVADLYGIQIRLTFDPDILQVEDANPEDDGVQIAPGEIPIAEFVAVNRVDNEQGFIEYAVTQLGSREPVTGSGVVASVQFRGVAIGTSPLTVEQALLSDKDGQAIPVETEDGDIEIK